MPNVYVDVVFSDLSERLAKKKTSLAGKSIFQTYMHLLVFAALVGQSHEKDWERGKVSNKGSEVNDSIFSNYNLDGVAYLLALHATHDGEILRDKNEDKVWNIIQGYADIGLEEIEKWLLDVPSDTDGVDAVLNKIKEKALLIRTSTVFNPDASRVIF